MKVLDLFSGIGGFSLGLERAGHETIAFCEIEPFCREVLKKHWPNVECHSDIKTLDGRKFYGAVDIICGGFPCQDISLAGKGAGLSGQRSGLWAEYLRIIKQAKPKVVIIENVSALRSRGLEQILRQLSEVGYNVQWHCLPASAIGANHQRDRVWIIAHSKSERYELGESYDKGSEESENEGSRKDEGLRVTEFGIKSGIQHISNAYSESLERQREIAIRISQELNDISYSSWWKTEPNVGRVANGVPVRMDRIKSLGNSIVPQIAEIIGRAVI